MLCLFSVFQDMETVQGMMYGTRSDSSVNNSRQLQPGWRSPKQNEFPVCTSSVDLEIMVSFGGILWGDHGGIPE